MQASFENTVPSRKGAGRRTLARLPLESRGRLPTLRLVVIYALFGTLWILLSDHLLDYLVANLELAQRLQTYKGWFFIAVTSALLWLLAQRFLGQVRAAEEALASTNRKLRAISNCNQVLLHATDERSLLQEICRIVCEEAGYRVAWVGYAEHDEARSVRPVAWTGAEEGYLATAGVTWADTERGRGPTGTAIRSGNTCCIQDFATDPRIAPWRESALQRGFRSGISLPLKDEHAHAFGSLVIYSAQANAFTTEEIRLLEELAGDLAFGVVTLRSQAARKQAEEEVALLSFALEKGREAAFLLDDKGCFQYVNDEACRSLGYSRAELIGMSVPDIDPDFPAEDLTDHWRDLEGQRSVTFESRHRTKDGRLFPVEISANYFEYEGRAYSLVLVRDITERKRVREIARSILESARCLVWEATIEYDGEFFRWDVRYTDEEAARRFLPVKMEPGQRYGDALYMARFPEDRERMNQYAATKLLANESYSQEYRCRRADGEVVWLMENVAVEPLGPNRTRAAGISIDITERKRAEEALHRLNRELRAISNCNQTLLRATDEQSLLKEICRIVCEEAGYRMAFVAYARHDEAKSVCPVAWAGVEEGYLANLGITWADTERGCGPTGTAIRSGNTCCVQDFATDPRIAPWREGALQHDFHSGIALPLKDEQASAFGCLSIYSAQPNAFTPEEIRLLAELAADLAFGIVTLRSRVAREQAEQKVSLLNFALDKVREAAFLIDNQGRCHYVNENASRILGYSRAELLGLGIADIDPDFPAERWPDHWRELKLQQWLRFESRHRTRDGHIFPVEVSANYLEYEGRAYNLALVRDITERKRAEEALRRSEAYLAEAQRLAHVGSWAWSPTTRQSLYWSEEMFRIFGLNPQDGVPTAETFWQRIHPEDLDRTRDLLLKAAAGKMEYEHEHRIVLPDGTVKHIHAVGHPALDQNGQVVEYVGTVVDVTERNRAEDELRKHREHLEELVKRRTEELAVLNQLVYGSLEAADVGAWWIDFKEPGTCHALDNTARMLGWEPDPTGKKTYKLSDWSSSLADTAAAFPEYASNIEESHERFAGAISGKYENYRAVYPLATPDGSLKWIDGRAEIAKRDEYGHALLMTGTFIDVTKLKEAEEALVRGRLLLRTLIDNLPDAIYAKDTAGRKTLANPADLKTLGCKTEAEAIGKSDFDLFPKDLAEKFWADDQKVIAGDPVIGREEYYLDEAGRKRWLLTSKLPLRNQDGKIVGLIGMGRDITLQKQAEEELVEAKERAEAANRAKSTFLANMSHELRTPLNAVLGFSRLLKKDPAATPQQQETLDVIVRSGEHLLNLINTVLDMAKIEAGRVPLKESEVDLIQLLCEMQSLMGAGAADKGLRFALERDPDLPRYVAVDAGKLRQVLLNLLGNAIKFTETGGVKLRARLASVQGPENARMRFEVEDTGPGLAAEDCERIFVPFVQLSDRTSAQAGTGLGLAICKEYVELMGGRIGVTSQPGKGSIFHFEIPLRILPAAAERDELKHGRILGLAEGQPRYRLLIVEDQPENRLLLRRTLDPLGFELREAANGQEAVTLFEQWQPHLIWMDIRMPVMDGLEAVRWIRATPAGKTTKIVALTAHALDEEREPIMAAGCDDLVRKPFHEQELFEALARHLRLKFIYETAPGPESPPEAPGFTLRPEQLNALPAQLLQDLRQAVVELDTARTQALIEQVTERDASLGQALNDLAKQLDYKRLLKLLGKE